jgi:hypothetical protein
MRLVSKSANASRRSSVGSKTIGGLRKTRHRGLERVGWMFTFALAAYNLVRIRNLVAVAA